MRNISRYVAIFSRIPPGTANNNVLMCEMFEEGGIEGRITLMKDIQPECRELFAYVITGDSTERMSTM
eukprot:6082999-Prorocentrum_lima.AAC.1